MSRRTLFAVVASVCSGAFLVLPGAISARVVPQRAILTGAGGGDPDGAGAVSLHLEEDTGQLCWQADFKRIAAPSALRLHAGPTATTGRVVASLSPVNGGCTSVGPELAGAVVAAPAAYYLSVENAEFPGGALRGQLETALPTTPPQAAPDRPQQSLPRWVLRI